MIKATNLSKSIEGFQILKGINIDIAPNEITVVFGPSGSGKTTLLRNLSLLDIPDTGELSIDNAQYNFPADYQNIIRPYPKMTVVFQQLFLWPHLTNKENITLALNKEDYKDRKRRLKFLITELEMEDYIDKYPNQSSLGQKQRVAIARALILKPNYIFFDEITAALDTVQTTHLIRIIKRISRQKGETGILFVTHNLEVAKMIADKVIFLDTGVIVERGTIEIFTNPQTKELKSFLKNTEHTEPLGDKDNITDKTIEITTPDTNNEGQGNAKILGND